MSDEKEQEKDTPSEPSTEETTEETVTEDDNMSEEQKVPKSRLDKEIQKRKELEAKLEAVKPQEKPKQATAETPSAVEERLNAVEFMSKHREFDAEDYEAANAIAKGRGVSLEEATKDNLFIAMQEKKASEKALEDATPSTGRSPKSTPAKPVSEMTEDEHKEYFKKLVNS